MAAGDFTASTSLKIQSLLGQNFNSDQSPAMQEYHRPVVPAMAIAGEQTAVLEELRNGDECRGLEVYWQKGTTDSPDYSGLISGDAANCTLTGAELESDGKLYTCDKVIRHGVSVSVDDCDNEVKANQRRAMAIQKAMNNIRVGFAVAASNFLDANAQVILNPAQVAQIDRGNGAWAVNVDTITIEVPGADLLDEKSLAYVEGIAGDNNMTDFFLIHGGYFNWYEPFFNANYTRENDNERSIFATFQNRRHYHDTRHLDATLASDNNTFLVNPHALAFVHKVLYQNQEAVLKSPKDGLWCFQLEDPEWMWSNGGVLSPVVYNVLLQTGCVGRDANNKPVINETYELALNYELATSPEGRDGETGIIKIVKV